MSKYIFPLLLSFILLSACGQTSIKDDNLDLDKQLLISPTYMPSISTNESADTLVSINTTRGQIVAKLYSELCPNTVANFIKKGDSGFYNNLIFHRVIPGFMAQGGDPLGTGTGGGQIASEINDTPFVRGSLGLARGGNRDISNDSQFFICFTTAGCQHLTGDYVNFGEVVSGMDILDQITQGDQIISISTKTK